MRQLRLIFRLPWLPRLLWLSLLCFPAAAQERATIRLTIEEAVKFGLAQNQNLAADREQITAALGRQRQAGLKANPMIEGSGLTSVRDTGMQNLAVGVTLPLEVGRRERRITLAEREVERMRHEVADRERMLAAEIRLKFVELLETRQNLALLTGIVELNREIRLLVGARVAEGVSPRLEENMQLVELRRSEAQVESLGSRLRVLTEELKGLIGLPEGTEIELAGELPATGAEAAPIAGAELAARARAQRPDRQAALAAEEIGEAMIAMARTEGRFDLSVFGELGWQRWRFDQLGQMGQPGQPSQLGQPDDRLVPVGMRSGMLKGGVNIMLPVRNRNQGNIEAAAALRQEARRRREFIESIITREVAAAQARLEGATRVLQRFDDQLIETQEKSLQITRASFELGHARLNDVLAEQRRLIELKMERNMARRELLTARIELSRATNE